METALKITAACVIAALLSLLLKKHTPELALLVTLTAAVVIFLFLGDYWHGLTNFLQEFSVKTGVNRELFTPLYKTVGIALVVKVGGNLCRDAGETALASVIETAGSLCALLVAIPLLRSVLVMLWELMG